MRLWRKAIISAKLFLRLFRQYRLNIICRNVLRTVLPRCRLCSASPFSGVSKQRIRDIRESSAAAETISADHDLVG